MSQGFRVRTGMAMFGMALLASGAGFSLAESSVRPRIIRPPDDRKDYVATSAMLQGIGDAVCAFVTNDAITDNGDGTFTINADTLATNRSPLCAGEPFGDQPTAAFCTATLIAPNALVTAGHCLDDNGTRTDLSTFYCVFDYAVKQAGVNPSTFNADQLVRVSEVLGLVNEADTANDWAVVRLEREITGRTPVPVRSSGSVAVGQSLVAIGFGAGLPMKFSDNSTVQTIVDFGFEADMDIIEGNSGGPIIDAMTGTIEGVVSSDLAVDDFYQDGDCFRATVCPQDPICTDGFTLLASVMIPDFQAAIQSAVGDGGTGTTDNGNDNGNDNGTDNGNGNDNGTDNGNSNDNGTDNDNGTGTDDDADGDGVIDDDDFCPDTPAGAEVDVDGCDIEDVIDNTGGGPVGICGPIGMIPLVVMVLGLSLIRREN